jgi:predicted ferric reductase
MSKELARNSNPGILPVPPAPRTVLLTALTIAAGTLAGVFVLPAWVPGLSESLLGPEPKAYWYLSRASGLVAFALVWLSMVWGLLITSRVARRWPGVVSVGDIHQHVSLLGLGFGLFHALILLGDRYANYSLTQLLIPFTATAHKPLWVGIGQVGFYLLGIVALSFYFRPWLGNRTWKALHVLSFGVYLTALVHGVMSGTDTSVPWVQAAYWISAVTLFLLTTYRVLVAGFSSAHPAPHPSAL